MAYGTVNADVIQSSVANTSLGAGNASIIKNRIINGAMVIDQRNSAGTPVQTGYATDRWAVVAVVGGKFNLGQSTTSPDGFTNSLLATSLSSYTLGANDTYAIRQAIEGYNIADLGWGAAAASAGKTAKTVTVSFWVRCSLSGTFGGALINGAANRSYTFNYTISSANVWEYKTITVAGDTAGTWATDNTSGLELRIGLGSTGIYTQAAGSWGTGNVVQPSGCVSVVGTNGATFYITGVQLEVGSSATGFEYRNYGTELNMCQRYYETGAYRWRGFDNGFTFVGTVCFSVTKRTTPTITNGGAGTASIFTTNFMVTGAGGNFDTGNVAYTASAEL